MKHSHPLEKAKFDDIRSYIAKYTRQIRSLSELKELIFRQFGIDYSFN